MIEEEVNKILEMSPTKKTLLVTAFILCLVLMGVLIYYFFYSPEYCTTLTCFQEASLNCKKAIYVNEDNATTWRYQIEGPQDDTCAIQVMLLNAKSGALGMDKLVGYDMICYETGQVSYPEQNLNVCHGRLKEEMQDIIVNKLHKYVIDNIEEISKQLSRG